jgi:hypothetical protein
LKHAYHYLVAAILSIETRKSSLNQTLRNGITASPGKARARTREAFELLEKGEQFGKIVLTP